MESDINKIRALCDRYFNGETSEAEEEALKEYFSRAVNIPDDLKAVGIMICGLTAASEMTYIPEKDSIRPEGKVRKWIWGTIAAAASIALCIALQGKEIYGYDAEGKAITDPETALEGTIYLSYLSQLETTIDIAQMISQEMEENN